MAKNKRQNNLYPLFLVLVFVFFSVLYALSVPLWEAPDEPAHYIRVRRIAEPKFSPPSYPGPLKTVWSERYLYSSYQDAQPPLYYLGAAAVLKAVNRVTALPDPAFLFPPVQPGFQAGMSLFLHPPLSLRVRLSALASVYSLRLFSVLLGALAVFLIYRLGRAAWPEEPAVALGAGGFAATLPQFNFISGAVGNDPAAALLGAGTLLYLVGRLGRDRPAGARYYLGLGVLLALGLLTKFNLVFLFPTAVVFIVLKNRPLPLPPPPPGGVRGAGQASGWGKAVSALALTATPLILAGAASAILFPAEFAGKVRVLGFRFFRVTPELLTGVQFRYMISTIYRSFFALFGWMSVPATGILYRAWGLVFAASVIGWIRRPAGESCWLRAPRRRPAGLLAAAAAFLLLGVIKNNLLVPQSQGRFLFPALGAIAVLFSAGFVRFFPGRHRVRAAWALLVLLGALNLIAWLEMIGRIS